MTDALPTDLDYNEIDRIVRNLEGFGEVNRIKEKERDLNKDKLKIKCLEKVFRYIGKDKKATLEDYYNQETIMSETVEMIQVSKNKDLF